MGWMVSTTNRPLHLQEEKAGWASGQVWKGAENFAALSPLPPNSQAHSLLEVLG
jgi:hypothetical protein